MISNNLSCQASHTTPNFKWNVKKYIYSPGFVAILQARLKAYYEFMHSSYPQTFLYIYIHGITFHGGTNDTWFWPGGCFSSSLFIFPPFTSKMERGLHGESSSRGGGGRGAGAPLCIRPWIIVKWQNPLHAQSNEKPKHLADNYDKGGWYQIQWTCTEISIVAKVKIEEDNDTKGRAPAAIVVAVRTCMKDRCMFDVIIASSWTVKGIQYFGKIQIYM